MKSFLNYKNGIDCSVAPTILYIVTKIFFSPRTVLCSAYSVSYHVLLSRFSRLNLPFLDVIFISHCRTLPYCTINFSFSRSQESETCNLLRYLELFRWSTGGTLGGKFVNVRFLMVFHAYILFLSFFASLYSSLLSFPKGVGSARTCPVLQCMSFYLIGRLLFVMSHRRLPNLLRYEAGLLLERERAELIFRKLFVFPNL